MSDLDLSQFPLRYARRVLLTCLVAVGMGQTVLFSILAPIGREAGLTEIQVGAILSASSITVFFTVPIWGRLSDRWGRKRVMLIGMFGYTAGTLLFASIFHAALVGLLIGTPAFLALVISRVMHASVMSATMPASSAYMADITTTEQRTKGMGAVGAANNIGALLGPAVGAGLAVVTLLTPLWFAAGAIFITGLVTARTLPEVPRRKFENKKPPRLSYFDGRIFSYVVVGALMFTGFAIVQNTMAFRMQDALSLTSVETVRMYGLGMGLAGPGFMAGASISVSAEEQGAIAGIAGSCPPIGFTIGPLAGTALYTLNPSYPYIFSVLVFCFLLVFVFRLRRH